jgi:D-alanyl-D-alanine carboxypeptidase (penicillin-binding protein 5/6)
MKKTVYSNPHGLCSPVNKSTAYELAILCRYAMQNEQFRRIVST